MHKAMSDVWKSKSKKALDIEKIIKNSVSEYFENSLLPKPEKEIILEELLENAGVVAKALAGHFSQEGVVHTDKWVESQFESLVNKEKIGLTLHGQMDTIVDTEKQVLVFDYKTRESMSENAIKGETKDSDGKYFRQLIFYKMLIQDNHLFKEKQVEPALVFIKPDSKGRCPIIKLPISEEDINRVEGEIKTLLGSVYSGSFLADTCDDKSCKFCGYKKFMG